VTLRSVACWHQAAVAKVLAHVRFEGANRTQCARREPIRLWPRANIDRIEIPQRSSPPCDIPFVGRQARRLIAGRTGWPVATARLASDGIAPASGVTDVAKLTKVVSLTSTGEQWVTH